MNRPYYTLCTWTEGDAQGDPGCWTDEFGSYSRREVESERTFAYDHLPRGHAKIIRHVDGSAAMMAARDALPAPKTGRRNAQEQSK